jgi:hypothetical protein
MYCINEEKTCINIRSCRDESLPQVRLIHVKAMQIPAKTGRGVDRRSGTFYNVCCTKATKGQGDMAPLNPEKGGS